MQPFLNDFITSLSSRRQERIYDLLSASQVQKQDLDKIVRQLNDITANAPILIGKESANETIAAEDFRQSFRDIHLRLQDLYQVSNLVSLLLDSHASVLSSDIKSIEDEILAMEKAVDGFGFLLSDGGAYDYSFIETFSDETMRDRFMWSIPDRVSPDFLEAEEAEVNTASGILTLSPEIERPYSLNARVLKNNCFSFITSDTGLDNALNTKVNSGWRVALSSPQPINSNIQPEYKRGAQALLEFFLERPLPCDTITIVPFADIPMDVLKIVLFKTGDDSEPVVISNEIKSIDRPTNFSFPLQSVAKFHVVINQTTYKRGSVVASKAEQDYRKIKTTVDLERTSLQSVLGTTYKKNNKVHREVFMMSEAANPKFPHFFNIAMPSIDFTTRTGPMTLDKILYKSNSAMGTVNRWVNKSPINPVVTRMFRDKIIPSNQELVGNYMKYALDTAYIGNSVNRSLRNLISSASQLYPSMPVSEATVEDASGESAVASQLNYEYNFGIHSIQIGMGVSVFKGVYLSKTIPAPGDSGEVKLKVSETNYAILDDLQRHSNVVTSTEYSVTNKSQPDAEDDWLPILPIDQTIVTAERFFPDEVGRGFFRFPASTQNVISLYKNGFTFNLDPSSSYIYSSDHQSIIGLTLPLSQYSTQDIFTCDYGPVGNPWVVNFEEAGFGDIPLTSAYDEAGPGQTYETTGPDRTISLQYEPYIDYGKVAAQGTYTTSGYQGVYQPVTIQVTDGTVPLNMTNYQTPSQSFFNVSSSRLQYIHSGKNIIFNRVVDSKFRVYYQYSPSNLRFRAILRVNDIGFVSPSVDYVQLKTKIRQSDSRKTI